MACSLPIYKLFFKLEVILFFFFNDTATTEIYTLSLHDALPIYSSVLESFPENITKYLPIDKSIDLATQINELASINDGQFNVLFEDHCRSEEHTSELQSHSFISYAVFCLKKKKNIKYHLITFTNQKNL